jgi:hypothetical protein
MSDLEMTLTAHIFTTLIALACVGVALMIDLLILNSHDKSSEPYATAFIGLIGGIGWAISLFVSIIAIFQKVVTR